jgi:hypothetical protein
MPVNIAARFGLKSGFTRQELVAFAGIQIDPGWHGRLAMSLFNAGPEPIPLQFGEKIFTIELQYLESPAINPYSGVYQDQMDFPQDQLEFITNASTVSLAEVNQLPVELAHVRQRLIVHEQLMQQGNRFSLSQIAAMRGIKPIENVEVLVGGWPEDADFETFLKGTQIDSEEVNS